MSYCYFVGKDYSTVFALKHMVFSSQLDFDVLRGVNCVYFSKINLNWFFYGLKWADIKEQINPTNCIFISLLNRISSF